jgi:hypothetical protein
METAAEYRAMADECFKWAREAQMYEVRASYRQLAQIWLDTASKTRRTSTDPVTAGPNKATKTTRSVGEIE